MFFFPDLRAHQRAIVGFINDQVSLLTSWAMKWSQEISNERTQWTNTPTKTWVSNNSHATYLERDPLGIRYHSIFDGMIQEWTNEQPIITGI